ELRCREAHGVGTDVDRADPERKADGRGGIFHRVALEARWWRSTGPSPQGGSRLSNVRYVQEGGRATFGGLPAPVVPLGGGDARVPEKLLHRADVRSGVQQIAGESTTEVVRGEGGDPGGERPASEDVVDRLLPHPP